MRRFLSRLLFVPPRGFAAPLFLLAVLLSSPATPADKAVPDEALGSVLMIGARGLPLDEAFLKTVAEGKIAAFVILPGESGSEGSAAGVTPDAIRQTTSSLRAAAGPDILVAVRQEGGQIRPLKADAGFLDLPSPQRLGQGNVHDTFETAAKLGTELISLGVNADLAPAANVDVNPFNPLVGKLGRAFNTDARLVAQHALAFGRGLAKTGVIPTLADFPGVGAAPDSAPANGADVPAWDPETDLRPYADIVKAGWPGMIMTANVHIPGLDGERPASLSARVITGLLRDGLGWQGVVITGDLQPLAKERGLKETLRQALDAGADLLLLENAVEPDAELAVKALAALRELRDEGKITPQRLALSRQRIAALRAVYSN